jgi:hypothetical protein
MARRVCASNGDETTCLSAIEWRLCCTGYSEPIYDLAEFLRTRPRPCSPLLVERRRARQESQEATSRENGPPARILAG